MTMPLCHRGRGRAPDPIRTAQTRDLILRSALDAFLERGFERTRMADVAARAGLAKGTLYLHFADKEALFEFVLQKLVSEPFERLLQQVGEAELSPRERCEQLFVPLLREFESSGRAAVLRLIVTESSRFPALAAIHRRIVIEPMMQAVGRALRGASGPITRFPQLMAAPVVMGALWNGVWFEKEPVDAADMYVAFLDAVFGAP